MTKKKSFWTRLSYLSIDLDLCGAMISIHPFSWVWRPAFKTHTRPFAHDTRAFQLFLGPVHFWRFAGRRSFNLGIEIELDPNPFGKERPCGDDALPFLWRWLTGKEPWVEKREGRA